MNLARFSNIFTIKHDSAWCKKSVKKRIIICVIIASLYGLAMTHVRFVLNATPSIPYKFFVLLKRTEFSIILPAKERYISFYHPVVQTRVIKQVKGVSGSRLHYDEKGYLWVDDFCVGKPHTTTRDGKELHATKPSIIPEGYVFTYAPHDQSFDSRYEEFGLIPVHLIQGVGVAVL